MNNDFTLEIKALEDAKNVDDKLMVFAIYYDLYNALVRYLDNFDSDLANNYGEFLSKSFELCVASTNLTYQSVAVETFINSYKGLLGVHMISRIEPIKELICYSSDNLEQISETMKYVQALDLKELNFCTKAKFVMATREHINNVFCSIVEMYGEEESYNLRYGILDELTDLMPEVLNQGSDLDLFRRNLKKETNKIVDKKIESKEFNFFQFEDDGVKSFISSLDEQELQIYILGISKALAGYQDNDLEFEPICAKDACQKLNMPIEVFESKASSLTIKSIEILKSVGYVKKIDTNSSSNIPN